MFNRHPRNRDAEKIAALEAENQSLRLAIASKDRWISGVPILVAIKPAGRLLRFTFSRNGQSHQIETYSTMSDDVEAWKRDLLQ